MGDAIRAGVKKLDDNIFKSRVGKILCFTLYFCQIKSAWREELMFSSTPSLRNID